MPEQTIYDRLVAEGLDPPESVKLVGNPRELTAKEREFAEALERSLTEHADLWQELADHDKRMTEDARICTWLVTAGLFDAADFDRRFCVYGKMGYAMVYYNKWAMIRHWARKAILAFKMGAT